MTALTGNSPVDSRINPVFVIAGGADVSPKGPDNTASFVGTELELMAKKGEWFWNNVWKLDQNPNSNWIGKLGNSLKKSFGPHSEVVTLHWSGSASPTEEAKAKKILRKQLRDVAKKFPGRPIIAICKSLSGPYLVRALQEGSGPTIAQFISLGSPYGRHDTIPDNIRNAVFIESDGDIFHKVGNWFRFLNLTHKTPKRGKESGQLQPTKITLQIPTHGELNYNTKTGNISQEGVRIFEGLYPTTIHQCLETIIRIGLSDFAEPLT